MALLNFTYWPQKKLLRRREKNGFGKFTQIGELDWVTTLMYKLSMLLLVRVGL